MIVSDAKVIAKTLTISDAVQGFPDVILFPLFVITLVDRMMNFYITVGKSYHLFKYLLTTHAITLNKP